MVRTATRFRWLLCLVMAIAMIVPAAAWGAHSLRHGMNAMAAGDHQKHRVSPPAPDQSDDAPAQDRQDGGHDHLLSLSVPVAALFDETPFVHPPLPVTAPQPVAVATLALWPEEPPPDDPPRTA